MKGFSPLRRWLRQERARVHLAAVASGAYTEPVKPRTMWLDDGFTVTETPEVLAPWQDITEGDETVFYTGSGRWV